MTAGAKLQAGQRVEQPERLRTADLRARFLREISDASVRLALKTKTPIVPYYKPKRSWPPPTSN